MQKMQLCDVKPGFKSILNEKGWEKAKESIAPELKKGHFDIRLYISGHIVKCKKSEKELEVAIPIYLRNRILINCLLKTEHFKSVVDENGNEFEVI